MQGGAACGSPTLEHNHSSTGVPPIERNLMRAGGYGKKMKRRWIWILIGGLAFFTVLGVGAAGGAALAYLALRSVPALAAELQEPNNPLPEVQVNLPEAAWIPALQGDTAGEGLVITSLDPEGPAALAGLARGDILMSLNGEVLDSPLEFHRILDDLEPGDPVELEVRHGDEERTFTVEVGEQNGSPYLGISSCGMPFAASGAFRLFGAEGARVVEVLPDTPAAEAGLQEGDLITAVDGEEVTPENSLVDLLGARQPGDEVTLTVEREDEEPREVTVTLAEHPEEEGRAFLGVHVGVASDVIFRRGPGGLPLPERFEEFPPFERGFEIEKPDLPEGVNRAILVVNVDEGSPAEEAGLERGDRITAIEGQPVESLEDIETALENRQPGDSLNLTVYPRGESEPTEVTVTLGAAPLDENEAYLGLSALGFFQFDNEGGEQNEFDLFFFDSPGFEFEPPIPVTPDEEL